MIHEIYKAELLHHVSDEGRPNLMLNQSDFESEHRGFPQEWHRIFSSGDNYLENFKKLWTSLYSIVPKTAEMVEKRLQGLAILVTDSAPPSLIYFFLKEGELYAHRGYAPTSVLPELADRISVSLKPFYSVHDGWVDAFTGDAGLLPSGGWKIIGREEAVCEGLLVVFEMGGSILGFDLDEAPAEPHILWSDGGVEIVREFWSSLDDWMYRQFEARDISSS